VRRHFFLLLPALFITIADSEGQQSHDRHALFSLLLSRYVEDGSVDYVGFSGDSLFQQYLDHLASTNPDSLHSRDDRLSLWINAYNAYTIKLIIDRMPLKSIRDISMGLPFLFGPWSIPLANVGGAFYTLNEIEHDIIREEFQDPRTHFALVCASKSCPKLREEAYEGLRLQTQLEEDTQKFINDPDRNRFDLHGGVIFLSKIFDWYESDLEREGGSVRDFLVRYSNDEARQFLNNPNIEIEYLPYDWSLNGK